MKKTRLFFCFCLLMMSLLAISPVGAVFAQDEEEEEARIEIAPTYPRVEAIAGELLQFSVKFVYFTGDVLGGAKDFQLETTAPQGWDVYMTPKYEKERKISAIRLEPSYAAGNEILLFARAPFWPLPEPGEYNITMTAISEDLQDTVELKAVITAKYQLNIFPSNERYNTTTLAGKENFFSLTVQSLSTAAIENVTFSSTKPEGWTIKFSPDKIEQFEPFSEQTIDVTIVPPDKTIAGDYSVGIRTSGAQATTDEINLRVTVETPTIWGWVGVIIILLVVAGLVVIFMRFSRR